MSKLLYINGALCDLNEKENPIATSYEVNDLAELKDRQAFSTNNFKLPLTQPNRRACGFPDSGSIIGLQPYRKNTAKIVQDGVEVLPNGIAIITGCGDAIQVQCLSGLIGFFDRIEGKSIRDLNLTAYQHNWTLANVVASQANTDGYIWPIIDYGSISADLRTVNVRQLRPAMFRKTLIEKIFAEAGYTVEGAVLTDPRYLKTVIPYSVDKFEHGKAFVDVSNTYTATAKTNAMQEFKNDFRDGVVTFADDATTDAGNHWSGTEYTATATIKTKVQVTYNVGVRDQFKGGSTPSITIRIEYWNGAVWAVLSQNTHLAQGEFNTYVYTGQVLEADADLVAGNKLRVTWHSDPATNRVYGFIEVGGKVAVNYVADDVIFGQAVQMEATLPSITQKDFLKDFFQNFGLIAIPDNYRKHIKLINMEQVYRNKYRAKDWTAKFTNTPADTDYAFGNYGINNYGKYKADEAVPDGTGWGVMVFDNQTLKKDIDLFVSQFAGSISNLRMSGLAVAEIKKIEDPVKSLDFKVKTEARILMDEKVNADIAFTDGATTTSAMTVSVPYFMAGGKLGLGYQEYFDAHYPEILRMLYRPFVQERSILLSAVDVANLDFEIPIYDKLSASYYYNNGVKDYIRNNECSISLVKLQ